ILEEDLGIDVYFCDPHSPWQKGTCENMNGLIRQYLPKELRKTLTYDRGREMAEHKILEEDLGIDVYFCDPHSPWQKGTCENMNGLIRQYLPKGIDLNQADQHYLNQVAMSLNTRPRKALDWLTPLEKFAQLVDYHKTFQTVAPHV
ncbi:IS30 family transposase, partial [Acinetobacter sp. 263903-1]|uniref:IS30 family transposase n=1 Tax=Acinetobacter sp. 263903-1 TaxID=1310678 RepID=UPI001D179203